MSSSLAVGLKKGFPVTKVEAAKRPSQAKGKFFSPGTSLGNRGSRPVFGDPRASAIKCFLCANSNRSLFYAFRTHSAPFQAYSHGPRIGGGGCRHGSL